MMENTPDYGRRIQRDCADNYSQRCDYAERMAALEREMSDDLYQAALTNIDLSVHGRMASVWQPNGDYIRNGRPEMVWETLLDVTDSDDFDKRLISFLVSSAKTGNVEAVELLKSLCDKYAHLNAEIDE